jgi:hypothetical protein
MAIQRPRERKAVNRLNSRLALPAPGAVLIVLLTGACATASKTYGPDGREAFVLDCSGLARNWGTCYEKAGDLCGTRGYEVINALGAGGAIIGAYGGGSVMQKSLVIQCKP